MNEVRISPMAVRDLEGVRDYIAKVLLEPGTAEAVVDDILDAVDLLAGHSELDKRLEFPGGLDSGYRYIIRRKHLIFYRVVPGDGGEVIYADRIIVGRRDYIELLINVIE